MNTPGTSGNTRDTPLDSLARGLREGEIPFPDSGRVLFLDARDGAAMQGFQRDHWLCVQGFKPYADALQRAHCTVAQSVSEDARFPLVLALPPRQRDVARAVLARAVWHAQKGGVVAAAMPNAEGARSGQGDLQQLVGPLQHFSKHKCRVFWTDPLGDRIDIQRVAQWRDLDATRSILDGQWVSSPGLFAWDRIDPASALLAQCLPKDLRGRVADLGAGYGFLSTEILRRCPRVTELDLYEAQSRAVQAARLNMQDIKQQLELAAQVSVHWHDVTAGLQTRYHAIVSNPPFHLGRADRPELGQAFIRTAAAALQSGGRFFMVANRHLPYEATLTQCFAQTRTLADRHGFKVIEAQAGRRR